MKKLAITGSICCGKSLVGSILQKEGAFFLSADDIVHKLISSNSECLIQITNLLGKEVFTDGKIDRKKVADKVFSNPHQLNALEKILHPKVLNEISEQYENARKESRYKLFAAEVPLLYEVGWEVFFDQVIVVSSDIETCLERFIGSGKSKEEFFKRMNRQIDPKEKASRADFHLVNDGTVEQLEEKVRQLFPKLLKQPS